MTLKLAILGASGHGKVVAEIAELMGYQVTFFDDAVQSQDKLEHWNVIGNTDDLVQHLNEFDGVTVAIGNNKIRRQKLEKLISLGANVPLLVHPSASVSKYATVEKGAVIMAGAVVNAFARVERGVIINTQAVVEHDSIIQSYAHICPATAIAGGCKVLECAWVGIGSNVRQLIEIGESAIIGAGSVVVKNIPAGVTAYGNPAKVVKD
ncbi:MULTISPECIES: acetyltransferase [Pseudoalteromonas]|uniref:Acetyltransferase n=1 Tax=Pseudoalteromonas amylolytica TaxID=1859457 RepID=A0A1S1MZT0_9GAMM|nr:MULTISPECIES: acetyltransferase [Pseudoalteromonas]OHU90672.1 acetyltransferase [Pseudoalteromonas sp. JW3]OHU92707.1 acetyltransferase [Pseudoalteromonas amylolytica]